MVSCWRSCCRGDGQSRGELQPNQLTPLEVVIYPEGSHNVWSLSNRRLAVLRMFQAPNSGSERDAQPEAGVNAAPGTAFNTSGRPYGKESGCRRKKWESLLVCMHASRGAVEAEPERALYRITQT